MERISREIQDELERRVATGSYSSVDDLLHQALEALDLAQRDQDLLERELLKGMEGEGREMTERDWDAIEQKALRIIASKKDV